MKKTIKDIDVSHKRLIVRCDFNVPLDEGRITDNARIIAAIPTIRYLVQSGAKVILMSHLGRPKGESKAEYSLAPVAEELSKLLDKAIIFEPSDSVIDDATKEKADSMEPGDVMLLENVRFRKEEEANDPSFSKELASYGDIFVNDAFGTAHRAHASTTGIADFLPSVSGFLIENELKFLGQALDAPKKPLVAILGGSKINDKIKVINSLIEKADTILIGGGMAFTFFKSMGYEIGKSLVDNESLDLATEIIANAKSQGVEFILPVDVVVASEFSNDATIRTHDVDDIPSDMMGLDIGPKTVELFSEKIKAAGTVLWNGPMGVFEMSNFASGTKGVGQAMAESQAITVIGGGDSAAAVNEFGQADKMTHVSTGGGASLELIEGKVLPGIAVLEDK